MLIANDSSRARGIKRTIVGLKCQTLVRESIKNIQKGEGGAKCAEGRTNLHTHQIWRVETFLPPKFIVSDQICLAEATAPQNLNVHLNVLMIICMECPMDIVHIDVDIKIKKPLNQG